MAGKASLNNRQTCVKHKERQEDSMERAAMWGLFLLLVAPMRAQLDIPGHQVILFVDVMYFLKETGLFYYVKGAVVLLHL